MLLDRTPRKWKAGGASKWKKEQGKQKKVTSTPGQVLILPSEQKLGSIRE